MLKNFLESNLTCTFDCYMGELFKWILQFVTPSKCVYT